MQINANILHGPLIVRILPLQNKVNSRLIPDIQLRLSIQNTHYIDKFTNASPQQPMEFSKVISKPPRKEILFSNGIENVGPP